MAEFCPLKITLIVQGYNMHKDTQTVKTQESLVEACLQHYIKCQKETDASAG